MQNDRSTWQEHASAASSDFLEKVGFKLSLKGNVRVSQTKGRRKKSGPNRTWRLTDQDKPTPCVCTRYRTMYWAPRRCGPCCQGLPYRESNRHCVTDYMTGCRKITLGLGAEC